VKAMFNDPGFSGKFALSAVNSINWARLMAQMVYYFYAAVRLGAPERPVAFSVPNGQFRRRLCRLCRGEDGPAGREADRRDQRQRYLHRAISSGDYSQGTVVPTPSPSMDIQGLEQFRAAAVRSRRA